MTELFADTSFWTAVTLPRDPYHHRALRVVSELPDDIRIVTSDLVLIEYLNYFSRSDSVSLRRGAISRWKDIRSDSSSRVIAASPSLLEKAADFYDRSADQSWSLTDCSSFVIMSERGIREALTSDHHFEQAGFRALLT